MALFFKVTMNAGQAYIRPQIVNGSMLAGAASPGELTGQIDGLIADLQRLKGEIPALHGWMSEGPLFTEANQA
jgi:hypothetical protein